MVESPHNFLHGCVGIRPVSVQEIDIVELKTLEAGVGSLDDVLPGQASVIGSLASPEDLGRDDEVRALPSKLADSDAHVNLTLAPRVNLGGVKKVDAQVKGSLHALLSNFRAHLATIGHPSTEGQARDHKAAVSEVGYSMAGEMKVR